MTSPENQEKIRKADEEEKGRKGCRKAGPN